MRDLERAHPKEVDETFHVLNMGNVGYVLYWARFFEMVKSVPGSIVECGIGRGRSLIVHTALNRIFGKEGGGGRKTFAFDSFEGFPDPVEEDKSFRNPQKGEWSHSPSGKYQYSPEFIYQVLANADMADVRNSVTLRKGFFSDTLPHYDGGPIALLHLDGDLYVSYRDPLNLLYDKVVPGGVIIFDDFTTFKNGEDRFPGGRAATEEFLADKPEELQDSIRGTPYIVKL